MRAAIHACAPTWGTSSGRRTARSTIVYPAIRGGAADFGYTMGDRCVSRARLGGPCSPDTQWATTCPGRTHGRREPSASAIESALVARMREPPQQREQAIENRACACRIVEPAPGLGDSERAFHFVRAAMCELVVAALVAATRALAFTQVERDAGRGGAQLGREIAIEALDGGQQGAELADQLERDIVGNEHGVCFPNARRRVVVVVWARARRRARHACWFARCRSGRARAGCCLLLGEPLGPPGAAGEVGRVRPPARSAHAP